MGEELVIIENEFIKLEKDELINYFGYLDRKYECSLEIQKIILMSILHLMWKM